MKTSNEGFFSLAERTLECFREYSGGIIRFVLVLLMNLIPMILLDILFVFLLYLCAYMLPLQILIIVWLFLFNALMVMILLAGSLRVADALFAKKERLDSGTMIRLFYKNRGRGFAGLIRPYILWVLLPATILLGLVFLFSYMINWGIFHHGWIGLSGMIPNVFTMLASVLVYALNTPFAFFMVLFSFFGGSVVLLMALAILTYGMMHFSYAMKHLKVPDGSVLNAFCLAAVPVFGVFVWLCLTLGLTLIVDRIAPYGIIALLYVLAMLVMLLLLDFYLILSWIFACGFLMISAQEHSGPEQLPAMPVITGK